MARYELYRAHEWADWRWRLKSGNGEIIASGEGYVTKHGARRGIDAHRRAACTERVVELTGGGGGGGSSAAGGSSLFAGAGGAGATPGTAPGGGGGGGNTLGTIGQNGGDGLRVISW